MSVRPGQTQRQGEGKGGRYLVFGGEEKQRKKRTNWKLKMSHWLHKLTDVSRCVSQV